MVKQKLAGLKLVKQFTIKAKRSNAYKINDYKMHCKAHVNILLTRNTKDFKKLSKIKVVTLEVFLATL